ncbi:MAG: hypothetical protein ACLS5K_01555 [Streptococcus salivarius]
MKDDAEGGDFYYLGDLTIVPSPLELNVHLKAKYIVNMNFKPDNHSDTLIVT